MTEVTLRDRVLSPAYIPVPSLYERLREIERSEEDTQRNIKWVREKGVEITVESQPFEQRKLEVLAEYEGNKYFRRLYSGENPKEIVKELVSLRTLKNRLPAKTRDECNAEIEEASAIMPSIHYFKLRHPLLGPTGIFSGTVAATEIIGFAIPHETTTSAWECFLLAGVIGVFTGALCTVLAGVYFEMGEVKAEGNAKFEANYVLSEMQKNPKLFQPTA